MAGNNMHGLTTLIKRLEAATSRLEDIASSAFEPSPTTNGAKSTGAPATPSAPRAVSTASSVSTVTPGATATSVPPSIQAFDALLDGDLKAYMDLSSKLDPVIAEQASGVVKAFNAQRQFLLVSTKAKKPDMASSVYMDLLKDTQQAIEKVDSTRQANRASPFKDHLSMVADGVGALGWVTAETQPKPADLVSELFGGAQMYGNKVLKQYKEKDKTHVEWVQSFYKLFKSLVAYIKQHHTLGIAWNKDGIDAGEALKQVRSSSATTNGAPPPPPPGGAGGPPPPPPLPNFENMPPPPPMPAASKSGAADMGAVFDQLNKGEAITSSLKKVDASQMTHKNPSLRTQGTVPDRKGSRDSLRGKSPAPPGKKPKPESMRTKKPPKKELDGNKWIIENYDSPSGPVEIDASMQNSILISKCNKTTFRIKGKANAISLDNSPRCNLIIDSLVSSVDVIKAPNFALQVMGTLPTVLLDQVDGGTIYLSKDCANTEIFTSKCSSININLPPESEEGDFEECPVPEQFRSYIKDGKLVTEINESLG